ETRFRDVYHQSLTSLFDDFRRDLGKKYRHTPRPEKQHEVLPLGTNARWTRSKTGHEAIVTQGLDEPIRLLLRDPHGKAISRNLTDILARDLVEPDVQNVSGLSFTKDGRKLYFVIVDRGSLYQASRLVVVDTRTGDLDIAASDLRGSGGSIAPDGGTYY